MALLVQAIPAISNLLESCPAYPKTRGISTMTEERSVTPPLTKSHSMDNDARELDAARSWSIPDLCSLRPPSTAW